jgi:hypothetical protein
MELRFLKEQLYSLIVLEVIRHLYIYLFSCIHLLKNKLSRVSTPSIDKYQNSAFFVAFQIFFLNSLFL